MGNIKYFKTSQLLLKITLLLFTFQLISFAQPNFRVEGIIMGEEPIAVVNGQVVKRGDSIEGAIITDITKYGVDFEYKGESFGKGIEGNGQQQLTQSETNSIKSYCESLARDAKEFFGSDYGASMQICIEEQEEAKRKIQSRSIDPKIKSHCEATIKKTLGHKDYDWILACIEMREEKMETREEQHETALISAARKGDIKAIKILIAAGADIHARDKYGCTALMWAASEGHPEIAKILITAGADFYTEDNGGNTALMWAAEEGQTETAKTLIKEGVDVNAKAKDGITALMWAAYCGHPKTVKALIIVGADVNAIDEKGRTALEWAVQGGHTETANLLKKHGIRK